MRIARVLISTVLAMAVGDTTAFPQITTCQEGSDLPGEATHTCLLRKCSAPKILGVSYRLEGACDPLLGGTCAVAADILAEFPGNHANAQSAGGCGPNCEPAAFYTFANFDSCGNFTIFTDLAVGTVTRSVNCGGSPPSPITLTAWSCPGAASCGGSVQVSEVIDGFHAAACTPRTPPVFGCEDGGGVPQGGCCLDGGVPVVGNDADAPFIGATPVTIGPAVRPAAAGPPELDLVYQAGGVGHITLPGSSAWRAVLGLGVSHRFAERFVLAPDVHHVWLQTAGGTFRELTDANMDGSYETVRPSDDRRLFSHSGAGFLIEDLDGTHHSFDTSGRWSSTTDRVGRQAVATYSGANLTAVDLPDGRTLEFAYSGARLISATEVGVDNATVRAWGYTWTGDWLTRIDRPDGSAWLLRYDDQEVQYLTALELLSSDGASVRVVSVYEYDAESRVVATWKGARSKVSVDAVALYELEYPSSGLTEVTDPYGNLSVWEWQREDTGGKPRVTTMTGDCPACGSPPETTREYDDPAHPLLPTALIDGEGHRTEFQYDQHGMVTERIEAVGSPVERSGSFGWSTDYPALPASRTVPSTDGACATDRLSTTLYDTSGRVIEQADIGCEAGAAFSYVTVSTYAASGQLQPSTINRPGHGTADLIEFDYDPARGNTVLLARHDPDPGLVGGQATTTYHHDPFNRRIATTDPNGLTTETQYADDLDRVEYVIQRAGTLGTNFELGDPPNPGAGDLVTESVYSGFGDLIRTILPRGNTVEYGHDHVGRLTSIGRAVDDQSAPLERTVYTLDDYGHRVAESHQRWNGTAWDEKSATGYEYSSRCHLDKVIHDPPTGTQVTEYTFDCNGNLDKVWDANHPRASFPDDFTEYGHDELDRLVSVTQPFGDGPATVKTAYHYDIQDHLDQVTDGEGNVTTYEYSDRDLLTQEVSPVSGTTAHSYDEHGQLALSTDARNVTVTRTVDAADRVTLVEYSGAPNLDVTFTYGDDEAAHEIGRLVGITRHGSTHGYAFDQFGRTIEDGGLVFGYDDNGNRTSITYPDGLVVSYTFDFADREVTLTANPGAGAEPIVTAATYLPGGPLDSLTFANGRKETRAFTGRYFPDRITLAPAAGGTALFDWDYTTDAVGNPTVQDDLVAGGTDRTFGYQDHQYYLTDAAGPWPGPLSWEYDRIGNRQAETRGANSDTYGYVPNSATPTPGNTALLEDVDLVVGGTRAYDYTPAGHVIEVDAGANVVDFLVDEEGRLGGLEREAGNAGSSMTYDGRGFLSRVEGFELDLLFRDGFERDSTECWSDEVPGPGPTPQNCPSGFRTVEPVYDSAGLLHALQILEPFEGESAERVLYFAGRPVGIARGLASTPDVLSLTTDNVGTPVAACDEAGALAWSGGFEPFGTDWLEGTVDGANENGVWLRFPGQWVDPTWRHSDAGARLSYNLHRWYEGSTGRYTRVDPLASGKESAFQYAGNSPLRLLDPLGLIVTHVDDSLKPFLGCAKKYGDGDFQAAWEWVNKVDEKWELRTQDPDIAFPADCIRKAPSGERSCTERPGGLLPWDWWDPGTFWIEQEKGCVEMVDNIVHEMREAHISITTGEHAGWGVHPRITGPSREDAERICEACCTRSTWRQGPEP